LRCRGLPFAIALALAPAAAFAHPHEWIDVASEVLFDDRGRIAAIRHHWRFDEAFSAFALQGLDTNADGTYSPEELAPLAQVNVDSLADYDFFTFVSAGDYQAGFAAPKDYWLDLDAGRLTLHYTLPLAQPLFSRGEVLVQVYDPEYYIAFAMPSAEAVRLVGAPAGCRLSVTPARGPDAAAAAALAEIGPDQRELPEEMQNLTGGIDNTAALNCGGPIPGSPGAEVSQGAAEATTALAETASGGDLTALPSVETGADAEVPEDAGQAGSAVARPAAASSGGITGVIAALQARFNRDVTAALKGLKGDGGAFWWLGGMSCLYGIVHAAGPGHGKVVISSYLVANEQRVRRGVAIAFLAALVQALVAIGIVGVMALVLNMTSMAMTQTAKLFEVGSFALVAALGFYLLARKGRQAWGALQGGVAHGHAHGHAHDHDPGCGCHHHALPSAMKPGLSGAAAAVASVGMRPCTGALVVRVVALAQGIFWAGIASTFLMALGTAITVAALAALSVGAKDLASRFVSGGAGRSGRIMLGLELAAAVLIAVMGVGLLFASLQA
jgi:nickel/cobalt exporter